MKPKLFGKRIKQKPRYCKLRWRDRVRLAEEEEEEEARAAENTTPTEEDSVYEDWSESEPGDVHSRQPAEQSLIPIRPLPSATPSMSSSSSKRPRLGTTPAREEKRLKIEPRLETMRKITRDLSASVERSIGGLSSQVGELAAAVRPDTEQAERPLKVESKLSTIEDTLVKIEQRSESNSKKLDTVLALLASRQE